MSMLKLDDPRWEQLDHAYGKAGDTPGLLTRLAEYPRSEGQSEPWFSIWSSLAHQGAVFPASFAAVPHIIAILAANPKRCDSSYLHFPAWVEICRVRNGVVVPDDLRDAYVDAVSALPALAVVWSERPCNDLDLACVLAAIAAAKGHAGIAEAALELRDRNAEEAIDWLIEHP